MQMRTEKEFLIANNILNGQVKLIGSFLDKIVLINMIPTEIVLEILSFLSDENWKSLFFINKDWRQFVISLANPYLDFVSDKIKQSTFCRMNDCIKNLLAEVKEYSHNIPSNCHPRYVQDLLNLEIAPLRNPLAQFLQWQKKISEIQKAMSYTRLDYSRSPLYCKLKDFSETHREFNWPEEIWFQNAKFFAEFSTEHPVAQLFSAAFLEINEVRANSETQCAKKSSLFNQFFTKSPTPKQLEKSTKESQDSEYKSSI